MNLSWRDLLEETISITTAAGREIRGFYQDAFTVAEKAPDNPVTDADLAADNLLRQRLTALLPEAGWLSEETADSKERLGRRLCWVVDPLDGTKEFVMGIPEFTVSVALVENGDPVLAVILNPVTSELFSALGGDGALYNGRPARVSHRTVAAGSNVDASRSERNRGEFEPFENLLSIRTMGSIAYKLARVSAGLADATWSRGPKNEWDICAGVLLVLEAGGLCVDLDDQQIQFNQPFPKVNGIIADNGLLHAELISALEPHRSSARVD
jgi:myo-inositol-1(or 4)-monophosphatase